jgi:AraC-like DNA-binding protein
MRAAQDLELHRRSNDDDALPFKLKAGKDGTSDTHLICGFFACDIRPFNPLLDALPRFMRIGRDTSSTTDGLLQQFIRLASAEIHDKRAGAQSVLNKLSELLFIEAIRSHMDELRTENIGWLSALRDPLVGRAITLLHAQPARSWTLDELAAESGASRSGLTSRFAHLMGYPPIQYLTRWRMQLAAKRLNERGTKIAAVAQEVGYESEAAFSRAFKKFSGKSPSDWRS